MRQQKVFSTITHKAGTKHFAGSGRTLDKYTNMETLRISYKGTKRTPGNVT